MAPISPDQDRDRWFDGIAVYVVMAVLAAVILLAR